MSKVKSKIAFNLTKRQLLCFGAAALVGVPLFLLTKGTIGSSPAGMLMILAMLPFFFLAMYEKDGLPFEKILSNYVRFTITDQIRTYQTNNFYRRLEQSADSDNTPTGKEVPPIEKKTRRKEQR